VHLAHSQFVVACVQHRVHEKTQSEPVGPKPPRAPHVTRALVSLGSQHTFGLAADSRLVGAGVAVPVVHMDSGLRLLV
jgi:hypothetical protein